MNKIDKKKHGSNLQYKNDKWPTQTNIKQLPSPPLGTESTEKSDYQERGPSQRGGDRGGYKGGEYGQIYEFVSFSFEQVMV